MQVAEEKIQNAKIALAPLFRQALWLIRRRISAEELHNYRISFRSLVAM